MSNPADFLSKILEPARKVKVTLKGVSVDEQIGETVLSLLVRNAYRHFRRVSEKTHGHGYYCAKGACFKCLVTTGGMPNQRA